MKVSSAARQAARVICGAATINRHAEIAEAVQVAIARSRPLARLKEGRAFRAAWELYLDGAEMARAGDETGGKLYKDGHAKMDSAIDAARKILGRLSL